ncbi:Uncharacterized protein PECH_003880 [Penicillium ucsense]|uniref:Uncharacterized protein n=1 Tax=Penicillium ucsense TaxID=2839758 RepID=A0A8J8W246_9EURO|nr:Uncharacterized protein PECM_005647 [Penicillium ucsense]KAF7737427.1 Uncharacterized protein PECH_003880 [Penicillium ucsense]
MEAAPLTLAHTHARSAVLETRKSNPVAASEEHDLAAGEFATAAQSTSDLEALRTLRLLEQHHKQLAELLRFQHEHPSGHPEGSSSNAAVSASEPSATPETRGGKSSGHDAFNHLPRLPGNSRIHGRESSSIASNLASARGIPAQPRRGSPVSPSLSTQQAGAKMADGPSKGRSSDVKSRGIRTNRQPWTPPLPSPTEIVSQEVVPSGRAESTALAPKQPATEDSFQRFYSTFEGLISRISAPLAFAGLPLNSEDTTKSVASSRKAPADTKLDRLSAHSDRSSGLKEPDVNRLFSRAALRSIHDMSGSGPGKPAESFYVVPTTGGTMSYAGILTRAEEDAGRNSFEETEEDFVDARETPSSPELRQSTGAASRTPRRGGSDKLARLQNSKTLEELQMENAALKQLSDTLSKRLHMWEVNAQSSSMALQQSLRAMHHHNAGPLEYNTQLSHAPNSPTATQTTPATSKPDAELRVKELEDRLRRGEQEFERVERENEKLNKVLGRYRERWEKLKEGAKSRRAEARPTDGQSHPGTPVMGHRKPDHSIPLQLETSSSGTAVPNRRSSGADLASTEPSEA